MKLESNFVFELGEAVFIEKSRDEKTTTTQTGIVVKSNDVEITDGITVHIINFEHYHDLPLTNEKARKATALNPGERHYTYSNIEISFLDVKNGKVKLYRITNAEPVFVKISESEESKCEQ